jgi:four helix bundle protein
MKDFKIGKILLALERVPPDNGGAMTQGKSFEELEVWQAAKRTAVSVFQLTRDGAVAKDFGYRDQLQRSTVAIMGQIAAGHDRGHRGGALADCLQQAKGATAEVRSLVHVGKELGYVTEPQRAELLENLTAVSRQLAGFIRYLEKGPPPAAAAGARRTSAPEDDER